MDRHSPHDYAAAMAHAQQQTPPPYAFHPQQYPPPPQHYPPGAPNFLNPPLHAPLPHQFPFHRPLHPSLLPQPQPQPLPPAFPPPADPELHKCIDKLAEYVAKNGPEFEDMIREKQHDNPAYSFLFGGDGHGYYRYRLWLCSRGSSFESPYLIRPQMPHLLQPLPPYLDQPQQPPPIGLAAGLPPEIAVELGGVLGSLNGTKESIKGAKNWFMQRSHFASSLAEALKERMFSLEDSERQMHIIFLVNDILFDSLQRRLSPQELDTVTLAFKPVLGALLGRIYRNPLNMEANRTRLEKILQFWVSKEVFGQDTIRLFEEEMTRPEPSLAIPSENSVAGTGLSRGILATPLDQSKPLPPQPHLPAPLPSPLAPGPTAVGPTTTPPYPLFPPGLIPGMVRKTQVGSGVPYSPISPLDIPAAIPPPSISPAETLDRVNRFFKEIGEANPGGVPGSGGEDYGEWERPEAPPRKGGACIPPPAALMQGEVDDGEGRGGGGRAGLGAGGEGSEVSQYDDVYSSYRKHRSSNYHSSMSSRSASGR